MLEKDFDYRQLLAGQYDFVTCQRPDGTLYGNGGAQCHRGAPVDPRSVGITAENWRDLGTVYGPETTAAVDAISSNLELLTAEQRAPWEAAIPEMCVNTQIMVGTQKKNKETGELEDVPESEYDNQMARRVNGYNKLLVDGPPTYFELRNGEVISASNPQPDVTFKGKAAWIDSETGMKYNHLPGKDTLIQAGAGKIDRNRRLDDAVEHRAAITKSPGAKNSLGKVWPQQEVAKPQQLDADEIMSRLSNKEKNDIAYNGLSGSKHGFAQHDIHLALRSNPAMREARAREIVERYAAQGGVSGATGKPVSIPGIRPKPGEERGTVDHLLPISTAKSVKNGNTVASIRVSHDNKKNFLITEEALNQGRGSKPWSGEVDRMVGIRDNDLRAAAKAGNQPAPAKFVGIPKSRTPAPSPRVRTTRSPSNTAARRERDLAKLDRELAKLREKRNRAKPGSSTFQRYSKQVNEKASERRKLDQSPLN